MRERIIDAQVDNVMPSDDASFPMFNGATGEVLNVVPTPNYLRLRRREFARVMGRDIDIRVGSPTPSRFAPSCFLLSIMTACSIALHPC